MLKIKARAEKRRHQELLEGLQAIGIIIEDKKDDVPPRDVESIIRKFMESAGWEIKDFADFLKLMDISLPVKLHTFMSLEDRIKFYEVTGVDDDLSVVRGNGDLKLICADKDTNPTIKMHAQMRGLSITRDYVISQNLGHSEKKVTYDF